MQRIECVYLFCPLVLKSLVTRVHTPKCGRESQSQSESSNYTIRDSTSSQCEVQQLPTKLLSKRCPPKKINNQKISLKKSIPSFKIDQRDKREMLWFQDILVIWNQICDDIFPMSSLGEHFALAMSQGGVSARTEEGPGAREGNEP